MGTLGATGTDLPVASALPGPDDDRREAVTAALALLARRSYSAAALGAKLRTKFDPSAADEAVARMVDLRLVDDRAFAEAFVRERFERRGYGRHRILRDLEAAGITAELAGAVVESAIERTAERERAEQALRRFLRRRGAGGHGDRVDAQEHRAAAFRHLVGRGFPAELVRDLIGVSL